VKINEVIAEIGKFRKLKLQEILTAEK